MKTSNHYAQALKGIVSNPFYKKVEEQAEPIRSERTIASNRKITKQKLPFLMDGILHKLHQEAKVFQTGDFPKKLTVYQNYLVWFADEQTAPFQGSWVQAQAPAFNFSAHVEQSTRNTQHPVLLGYVNIKGFHVDSNESVDTIMGNGEQNDLALMSPKNPQHKNMYPLGTLNDGQSNTIEDQAPSPIFMMEAPRVFQRSKFYFKLHRAKGDPVGETIFFQTKEEQEEWRQKIAAVPVFFGDFDNRFKVVDHLTKEGKSRLLRVSAVLDQQVYIAKTQKISTAEEKKDSEAVKQEFLQESSLLLRLKSAHLSANFMELHFSNSSCIIVQEELDGILFSDWYSEIWCFELVEVKDATPILSLLLELSMLLLSLNSLNIAHGNLSKESILVQMQLKDDHPASIDKVERVRAKKRGLATLLYSTAKRTEKLVGYTDSQDLQEGVANFSPESPNSPARRIRNGNTSIYSKRRFYILGLAKAVDTTVNIEPKSKGQIPDTIPGSEPAGRYTTYSKRHAALASDIFNLGIIFYEILFGIDINKALQQNFGLESEFVSNLVERPHQFIGSREPLYQVDNRLIELLAWMLFPDPTQRPSVREVYSTVECSMMDPTQAAPPVVRGARKHTTFVSRVSMDSMQTPMSYRHPHRNTQHAGKDLLNTPTMVESRRKIPQRLKSSDQVSRGSQKMEIEIVEESPKNKQNSPTKSTKQFFGEAAVSSSFITSRAKAIESLSAFSSRRMCKRKLLLGNIQIPIPPQRDHPMGLATEASRNYGSRVEGESELGYNRAKSSTKALEFAQHRNHVNVRMLQVFRAGREQFRLENKPKEIELANLDSLVNVPSDMDSRKRSHLVHQISGKLDSGLKKSGSNPIVLRPRALTILKGKTIDTNPKTKKIKSKDRPASQAELDAKDLPQDKPPMLKLQFARPGALTLSFLRTDGSRVSGSPTKLSGFPGYSDQKSSSQLRKSLIVASKPLAKMNLSKQKD